MNNYTAADKIKVALDWVAKLEPIAVPTVLTRWSVRSAITVPTMATNGREMIYNPVFVDKLSLSATKAIVLHEVGHVLSNHQHRRGKRNPKGYNIAADLALNDMLRRGYLAAFGNDSNRLVDELMDPKSPSNGCFVGYGPFANLPRNLSAEEYYDLLKAQNPPPPPVPTNPDPRDGDKGEPDECDGDEVVYRPRPPQDGDDTDADEGNDSESEDSDESGSGEGSESDDESDESDDESGSGEGSESDDESDDESGSGERRIDGSDFDESDDEDSDSASGDPTSGKGNDDEHDPFADLPDPSETFGTIEDAPDEVTLREDEAKLILEALLGSPTYSPTGLGDIISEHRQRVQGDPEVAAQVNWRKELEKFIRVQHASGWKYDRPSRRHSHRKDLVLPARRARSKTTGLMIVDTSGSMSDEDCNQAITHLGKVLALFPQSTVTLAHCDTAVRSTRPYRASDFPISAFEGWKGRGGTDLNPAFRWAKQNRSQFDWLIVLTDMEWSWGKAIDPGLPTLWINTRTCLPWGWDHYGGRMPFGRLVNVHALQARFARAA